MAQQELWYLSFQQFLTFSSKILYVCKGTVQDRTSSLPMSVLCLLVDKGQGL